MVMEITWVLFPIIFERLLQLVPRMLQMQSEINQPHSSGENVTNIFYHDHCSYHGCHFLTFFPYLKGLVPRMLHIHFGYNCSSGSIKAA